MLVSYRHTENNLFITCWNVICLTLYCNRWWLRTDKQYAVQCVVQSVTSLCTRNRQCKYLLYCSAMSAVRPVLRFPVVTNYRHQARSARSLMFHFRRLSICPSLCLSVCVSVINFTQNYQSDLYENFTTDVSLYKKELTKFWKSSDRFSIYLNLGFFWRILPHCEI